MKSPYRFYVYMWRHKTTGKSYVGKGTGHRMNTHTRPSGAHRGSFIHRAIAKYGREAFDVLVLEDGLTTEEAGARESYYIASRNTRAPNGYNLTDGGDGARGVIVSAEQREAISRRNKGRVRTPEMRARISAGRTGLKLSPEACAASAGKTGLKYSAAQCEAISKALLGHIHSDETRAKISAANKGKTKGRPKSPEHRAKLTAHLQALAAKRKRLAGIPIGHQLSLL